MTQSGNLYFDAVVAHYEAEIARAKANLANLFENPAAVGGHSDLVEEITKWTEILAKAEGCYGVLFRYFKEDDDEEELEDDDDELENDEIDL